MRANIKSYKIPHAAKKPRVKWGEEEFTGDDTPCANDACTCIMQEGDEVFFLKIIYPETGEAVKRTFCSQSCSEDTWDKAEDC